MDEILLYRTPNDEVRLEVFIHDEKAVVSKMEITTQHGIFEAKQQKNCLDFMVSQNAIPSRQHLGGALPYVFTEQGVSVLSAVLRDR